MVHCPNFDTRKNSEILGSIQASCNRAFVFGTLIDFCRRQLHWGSEKRKLHRGSGLRNFYTLICVKEVTTSLLVIIHRVVQFNLVLDIDSSFTPVAFSQMNELPEREIHKLKESETTHPQEQTECPS